MKRKLLSLFLITPLLLINFSFDDLRVNDNEKLGKPGFWDKLTSGQLWTDWSYGAGKVSVRIWSSELGVSGLKSGYEQVNVKVQRGYVDELCSDFKDAEVSYIYNETYYSYITVEMSLEDIAQKFWGKLFSSKVTLADKAYVESISLNQELTLIQYEYADKNDVARTTYELCDDYGVLDMNYSGKNISIAVLDTGVKRTHLGFQNSTSGINTTIYNESFVPGEDWQDRNGHGTHCIGIIAGQETKVDGTKMRGIAPNATIYSLKVLDSKGRGTEDDIIRGIMRAVELNVDIISMSLGGYIDYFSSLHDAIQYAVGKGVIVVAAAGNSAEILSAQPASWEGVISVEALNEQKRIAPYTCLGGDIAAEGTNITSLDYADVNDTATYSGTSMATPLVAGCVALLLEAQPSLRGKPTKVASYLKSTGNFAPSNPSVVKIGYIIPVTASNYCYDTRDVNPKNLVSLKEISSISREEITDVRTQLLRNNGV